MRSFVEWKRTEVLVVVKRQESEESSDKVKKKKKKENKIQHVYGPDRRMSQGSFRVLLGEFDRICVFPSSCSWLYVCMQLEEKTEKKGKKNSKKEKKVLVAYSHAWTDIFLHKTSG